MDIREEEPKRTKLPLKIFSVVFVIVLIAGLLYGAYFKYNSFCSSATLYSIGDIDSRFNLSKDQILTVADDAARRWNKDDIVLKYDPSSSLKINLVYDQRQADLDKLKGEVASLNSENQSLESWNSELQKMVAGYNKDLKAYNEKVSYWNSQGGAPAETFEQLEKEKKALEARRVEINKLASLLNIEVDKYNLTVDQIRDQSNKNANQLITQGVYSTNDNQINIYTFGNEEELRLVLMHELGHSLGFGHGANPASIMYAVLGEQEIKDPAPSAEDFAMLDSSCKVRISNLLIYNFSFLNGVEQK